MAASEPREEILRRRLAAPLGTKAGSEHPDPELVVAHAANELSPEYSLAITRHLTVCDDGRCTAVLRDVVAGVLVTRDVLYGRDEGQGVPPSEAPPSYSEAPPAPSAPSEAPPEAPEGRPELSDLETAATTEERARTFECADDLWEAFTAMAQEQGASVDELLGEAMSAYAEQRSAAMATGRPPAMTPTPLAALREVTFREAASSAPRERNTPTLPRAYLPRAPAASWRAPAQHAIAPQGERLSVMIEGVRQLVTEGGVVVGRGGPASRSRHRRPRRLPPARRHRAGGRHVLSGGHGLDQRGRIRGGEDRAEGHRPRRPLPHRRPRARVPLRLTRRRSRILDARPRRRPC